MRSHDDVRPERDHLHREFTNEIGITCGPAVIDPYVAAVSPARLLQSLHERRDAGLAYRVGSSDQTGISTPMRRTCAGCCAHAGSGHTIAAPPSSVMNSRRLN
jgi:hypothetical protein